VKSVAFETESHVELRDLEDEQKGERGRVRSTDDQGGLISTPLNSIFNELFVNPMATIVTSPDPTENKAASN
jgi:hypothetical protein